MRFFGMLLILIIAVPVIVMLYKLAFGSEIPVTPPTDSFGPIDSTRPPLHKPRKNVNLKQRPMLVMQAPILVKFKKLDPAAVTPTRAHPGDAGWDLAAISSECVGETPSDYIEYGTGIAVEIPDGYVGLLFPRSSVSRVNQFLANCVGVLDSGYRGEIKFRFRDVVYLSSDPLTHGLPIYGPLDKIGQLVILPLPLVEMVEVDELSDSERGSGGFGSTGT